MEELLYGMFSRVQFPKVFQIRNFSLGNLNFFIVGLQFAEYNELSLAQCPVTCVSYHPFDHWVAFAIYGLRQPILIYKHDSSGKHPVRKKHITL